MGAASIYRFPVPLRKARSVLMLQAIAQAMEEESAEIYDTDFKEAVLKAVGDVRGIYAALCTELATTGEL